MRWIGISGSRTTDARVLADIADDVAELMLQGDGIIAGGALGVDRHATAEALRHDPNAARIQVIIPADLGTYRQYFVRQLHRGDRRHNNATPEAIDALLDQLAFLKARSALLELPHTRVNAESFHARNRAIVVRVSELRAYCVNRSSGTMYTARQSELAGIPATVRHYTVPVD
jgi:hypothetical protein